ncbi:MAG: tetratricopeptide repeat protein [Acidobacteria bacterium]|nr:tetratricopeptide repeat protein [Acidobacteriota bacterium]
MHRLPKLYQVLGTALLQRRDYAAALENLSTYLQLDPSAPDIEVVRKQVAELTRWTAARSAQAAKP